MVLNDAECTARLFAYLDTPITNRTLAGYFAGVISALLGRNANKAYHLAFEGNKFPLTVLKNIHSKSLADLAFRLLYLDTTVSDHYLLERFTVLKELLAVLGPSHNAEEHANGSTVLCDLIRQMEAKSWKLLICWLIQRPQLEALFANVLCGVETASTASLSVLNALLSCECICELVDINLDKVIRVIQWSQDPGKGEEPTDGDSEAEDALIPLLMQHLPAILALLEHSGEGTIVGPVRLQVLHLVDIMLRQKSPVFESLVIAERGLYRAFALFLSCPLNSLLQKEAEILVHTVMEKGSEDLRKHLMLEVNVPLLLAQAALDSKGPPGNSGCGHMGYITRIANYLKTQSLPWWQPCDTWTAYEVYLDKVNNLENVPKKEADPEPEFDIDRDMPQGEEEEEISLSALVSVPKEQALLLAAIEPELGETSPQYGASTFWKVPLSSEELPDLD